MLLDENLKEMNLSSPTLVSPLAFARLQRALWSDTGEDCSGGLLAAICALCAAAA